MSGTETQTDPLFIVSFALSLFSAIALWIVGYTSPSFKGVNWLSAAYLVGAVASAARMLHSPVQDPVMIFCSNVLVLLVYVLLHCALLRVLQPGGSRPWIGTAALVLQLVIGPFVMYGSDVYHKRVLLIGVLLAATLAHVCYVIIRQGLPSHGGSPSAGMRASTASMVVILTLNAAFSLLRGTLFGQRRVSLTDTATHLLNTANMVVTIVCAVGILLSFLWMTAERLQRDLEIQARQDGLTDLLNRRALEEEFRRESLRAERTGEPLTLMLLDLDHFKFINDLYGHHAGDLVLCEVALAMKETLRRVDLIARIGGEEFVALLPQTTLAEAESIAERLRREIQMREVPFGTRQVSVTASLGVAYWGGAHDSWENLLRRADAGMYRAKSFGRNRVEIFAS